MPTRSVSRRSKATDLFTGCANELSAALAHIVLRAEAGRNATNSTPFSKGGRVTSPCCFASECHDILMHAIPASVRGVDLLLSHLLVRHRHSQHRSVFAPQSSSGLPCSIRIYRPGRVEMAPHRHIQRPPRQQLQHQLVQILEASRGLRQRLGLPIRRRAFRSCRPPVASDVERHSRLWALRLAGSFWSAVLCWSQIDRLLNRSTQMELH